MYHVNNAIALIIIDHLLEAGTLSVVYKLNLWTCAGCPSSSNNLLHTLFDIKTRKRGERKGAECDGGCRRSVPLSQMATGSDIAPRNKSPQEKIGTWCDRFARLGEQHDRCSTVCTAISDTMKVRLLH